VATEGLTRYGVSIVVGGQDPSRGVGPARRLPLPPPSPIFVGIAGLVGVAYLNVLELTMDLVDSPIGSRR